MGNSTGRAIAGVAVLLAFGSALSLGGGCSSAGAVGLLYPGDGGALDATVLGDDGDADDGSPSADAGPQPHDSGSYTGLRCEVTPCVVDVAAGGSHMCALLDDRTVRCWGNNASGELGTGILEAGVVSPPVLAMPTAVVGIGGAREIAAGGYGNGNGTSCAAVGDGNAVCWGSNAGNSLGLGLRLDAGSPGLSVTPLPLALAGVSQLALGGLFGCAIAGDGGVACWGDDSEGELARSLDAGTSDPTPSRVPLSLPATSVATGKYHACAILSDQTVRCWGAADHGQTGHVIDGGTAVPYELPGLQATQLSAGEASTCAITTAGGVACWGENQTGQLGRGSVDAVVDPTPGPVALPAGATALQIASAVGSTCALLSDHTVWCWGDNAYGELGTGSAVPGFSSQPVPVAGLSNIVTIASSAGGWNVCALLQNGTLRCWGVNNADQLGVDTSGEGGPDQSPHAEPVRVLF